MIFRTGVGRGVRQTQKRTTSEAGANVLHAVRTQASDQSNGDGAVGQSLWVIVVVVKSALLPLDAGLLKNKLGVQIPKCSRGVGETYGR